MTTHPYHGYVVLGLGAYQEAAEGLLEACQNLLEDYIAAREMSGEATDTTDIRQARDAIGAALRVGIAAPPPEAPRLPLGVEG